MQVYRCCCHRCAPHTLQTLGTRLNFRAYPQYCSIAARGLRGLRPRLHERRTRCKFRLQTRHVTISLYLVRPVNEGEASSLCRRQPRGWLLAGTAVSICCQDIMDKMIGFKRPRGADWTPEVLLNLPLDLCVTSITSDTISRP